jgi:hypothetical protein
MEGGSNNQQKGAPRWGLRDRSTEKGRGAPRKEPMEVLCKTPRKGHVGEHQDRDQGTRVQSINSSTKAEYRNKEQVSQNWMNNNKKQSKQWWPQQWSRRNHKTKQTRNNPEPITAKTWPQCWRLILRREAATECSGGPSKSTIVNIFDVAEVVKNGKVKILKVSTAKH